jgi:uncharacterized membrane protein YphA (DoxX/SURF4 family)/thiol-disulfide isomerase/thioredoxin
MKSILNFELNNRSKLVWCFRILIFVLFAFSGVAKLMPIEFFEKQLVSIAIKPGVLHEFTNWCTVPVWSRVIIIFELFLGFSLLIPFYQRNFTIPMSISMLIIFIIHLSIQISFFGNSGNCGCMGELIPMTPLNAIIKNVVTILILVYLFCVDKKSKNSNPVFHFLLFPAIFLSIFILFPITKNCCCEKENYTNLESEILLLNNRIDTLVKIINSRKINESYEPIILPKTPKIVVSEFHNYKEFELNGKKLNVNIDEGKSIVCVFNPDCDHCLDLSSKISKLSKDKVKISFLFFNPDETNELKMKSQILSFMKKSNISVPFKIIDIHAFNRLLINTPAPPRLTILDNGKIVYDYLGTGQVDLNKINKIIY